jgi:hypothetical protein
MRSALCATAPSHPLHGNLGIGFGRTCLLLFSAGFGFVCRGQRCSPSITPRNRTAGIRCISDLATFRSYSVPPATPQAHSCPRAILPSALESLSARRGSVEEQVRSSTVQGLTYCRMRVSTFGPLVPPRFELTTIGVAAHGVVYVPPLLQAGRGTPTKVMV